MQLPILPKAAERAIPKYSVSQIRLHSSAAAGGPSPEGSADEAKRMCRQASKDDRARRIDALGATPYL